MDPLYLKHSYSERAIDYRVCEFKHHQSVWLNINQTSSYYAFLLLLFEKFFARALDHAEAMTFDCYRKPCQRVMEFYETCAVVRISLLSLLPRLFAARHMVCTNGTTTFLTYSVFPAGKYLNKHWTHEMLWRTWSGVQYANGDNSELGFYHWHFRWEFWLWKTPLNSVKIRWSF